MQFPGEARMESTKSYKAKGKVQGIMFRQTVIRGAQKRSLQAGATNDPEDENIVRFTLSGDEGKIKEMINKLTAGVEINSWGAKVESLEELSETIPVNDHAVTTSNVDDFKWSPGVEFYL